MLTVTAVRATAACPLCQHRSKTVHSSYTRTVVDLPWSGMTVSLRVQTRRFACPVESCERKIFCERLTQFVAVYGRRTDNVRTALQRIARALGGKAGARVAAHQRIGVSRLTLPRLIHADPAVEAPPRASSASMTGADAAGVATVASSSTSSATARLIYCPTARRRPSPPGCVPTQNDTPVGMTIPPTEQASVTDPTHPLYGLTLPCLGVMTKQLLGRACVVWLAPGVTRLIPVAATDRGAPAECATTSPSSAMMGIRPPCRDTSSMYTSSAIRASPRPCR